MKKFEYYLLEMDDQLFAPIDLDDLMGQLDELGKEGWEVVAVTDRGSKWWSRRARRVLVTLKREIG
jgi:hypothetical protein